MTVARGGVVAGGVSACAPAFASASLTGPARVHNPTCKGHARRIGPVGKYWEPGLQAKIIYSRSLAFRVVPYRKRQTLN